MSFVPNIKYKTEYCLYWQEGKHCEKGTHCFFAHGPHELHTIEQNHQEILTKNKEIVEGETKPHNYKTIFCKFYSQGQCKLGQRCTYAHQRRERRKKNHSQEYKSQHLPPGQPWNQHQLNQYYQQLYYYQMYQMQPAPYHYPTMQFASNQPQLLEGKDLEEKQLRETNEKDLKLSAQIQNINQSEYSSMKVEDVEVESPLPKKIQDSPSSGETDAATNGTLTRLDSIGEASEFKTQQREQ